MDAQVRKALNYALRLFKYRQRSEKEYRDRLQRKKYPGSVIEKVMTCLREYGYLDDTRFAFAYTRDKFRAGYGRRRVQYDLRARFGVDPDTIASALGAAAEDIDIDAMGRRRVEKLLAREKTRSQIVRSLSQRGFRYDDILRWLDED